MHKGYLDITWIRKVCEGKWKALGLSSKCYSTVPCSWIQAHIVFFFKVSTTNLEKSKKYLHVELIEEIVKNMGKNH